MDTRTAVWVSTPEKCFKIVLGETRNVSQKSRGVSAPALYKNPAVTKTFLKVTASRKKVFGPTSLGGPELNSLFASFSVEFA